MRGGELFRDLEASISAPDYEHRSAVDVVRPSIRGAVELRHARVEVLGEPRHERHLKRPGRNDDLIGADDAAAEIEDEPAVRAGEPTYVAVELNRKLELLRVVL